MTTPKCIYPANPDQLACACPNQVHPVGYPSMKKNLLFVFASWIFLLGACSENHLSENGSDHGHVHQALRGGILLELGEHGSGHNLELLLNESDELEIFILDAHAENYVRINQASIALKLGDGQVTLSLQAVSDPATGESVGDTSLFRSTQSITELLPFSGKINDLKIGNSTYQDVEFAFSGNPKP